MELFKVFYTFKVNNLLICKTWAYPDIISLQPWYAHEIAVLFCILQLVEGQRASMEIETLQPCKNLKGKEF